MHRRPLSSIVLPLVMFPGKVSVVVHLSGYTSVIFVPACLGLDSHGAGLLIGQS